MGDVTNYAFLTKMWYIDLLLYYYQQLAKKIYFFINNSNKKFSVGDFGIKKTGTVG